MQVLVIVLILLFVWFCYQHIESFSNVQVISSSNRSFQVLDEKDAQSATELLSQVSVSMDHFLTDISQSYPTHMGLDRIRKQWSYQKLAEGRYDQPNITSYTVNKGERIVLCLRSSQGKLHQENLIFYVLLHELAHIMSLSTSTEYHNQEFKDNLNWLVTQAHERHYLETSKAVDYCGMPDVRIP